MAALPVYPILLGDRPVEGRTSAIRARLVNADVNAIQTAGPAQPVLFVKAAQVNAGLYKVEGPTVDLPLYEVPLTGYPVLAGPALLVYVTNPTASPSGRA